MSIRTTPSWIANEFANAGLVADWGTTIAHFTLSGPAGAAIAPRSSPGVPVQKGGMMMMRGQAKPSSGISVGMGKTPMADMHRMLAAIEPSTSNEDPFGTLDVVP